MFGNNLERLESETHLSTNLVLKCYKKKRYFNIRINVIYENLLEIGLEKACLDFGARTLTL